MHDGEAGAPQGGLLERKVERGIRARGAVHTDDHRSGRLVAGRTRLTPHHHHGAMRVGGDLNGDRSDQQPGESAEAATANDDYRGRSGLVDEQRRKAERREVLSWSSPPSWSGAETGAATVGLGNFLVKVGSRPGIPVHLEPTAIEKRLGNTNARWTMARDQ